MPAWPENQPATDNANVRWLQPFPDFARRAAPRLYADPILVNIVGAPEVITMDKWYRPFVDPNRLPVSTATRAASGMLDWPFNQPAADNANASWFQPFSLPQRFPRDPRYTATLAAGELPRSIAAFTADNANVRWLRPFAEPVRYPADPRALVAETAGMIGWASKEIIPNVVSVGAFYQPWLPPTLPIQRRLGELVFPVNTTVPLVSGWQRPFAEPVRFLRDERYKSIYGSQVAWAGFGPIIGNANVRWMAPLSEPRRFLRDPRYGATLEFSFSRSPTVVVQYLSGTGPLLVETRMRRPPTFWKGRS